MSARQRPAWWGLLAGGLTVLLLLLLVIQIAIEIIRDPGQLGGPVHWTSIFIAVGICTALKHGAAGLRRAVRWLKARRRPAAEAAVHRWTTPCTGWYRVAPGRDPEFVADLGQPRESRLQPYVKGDVVDFVQPLAGLFAKLTDPPPDRRT